jgi:hypothetical protein
VLESAWGLTFVAICWLVLSIAVRLAAERFLDRIIGQGPWAEKAPLYLLIAAGICALLLGPWYVVHRRVLHHLDRLATQGMDREAVWRAVWADQEVRRLEQEAVEQAEEEIDRRRFEEERVAERPWWVVELSGAHLLWWVSFALLLTWNWEMPDWLLPIIGPVAFGGAIMKVFLPFMWWGASKPGTDRRNLVRYYRWWGKGLLPMVVALLPAAAYWLAAVC